MLFYVVSINRKIIEYSYNGCGDSGDQSAGHGTHVSGTIIGAIPAADLENGKFCCMFKLKFDECVIILLYVSTFIQRASLRV